jgi:excisionase family DNA binding protein
MTRSLGSPDFAELPTLLDVKDVAALLGCSSRHIYRLADGGRMPAPLHVGALVRWRRADIAAWIEAGCGRVRVAERE